MRCFSSKHWINSFTDQRELVRKYLNCILSDGLQNVTLEAKPDYTFCRMSDAICEFLLAALLSAGLQNVKQSEHFNIPSHLLAIATLSSIHLISDALLL